MLSKALPSGLALATLLVTGPGFSDAPRVVRLEYQRQEGAATCPDEAAIRAGVAARLGYEPFRERAQDLLRANLRQAGPLLEARIELLDAKGDLKAARRLTSRKRDCSELAAAVELAIAIAIDPMGSPPPAEEAPPAVGGGGAQTAPPAGEVSPAGEPTPPLGPAPAPRSLAARAQVGLVGGLGSAPSASLGFTVGGALESAGWSLGIEGRADLPSSMALRAGEASAWLLVASFVPCLRLGIASGCALATGGARQVAGDGLIDARHATLAYLAFGGRLAVAVPLARRAALALNADVTAPVTQARLTVDNAVVWTSPAIAFALGAGLAVNFP